MKTGHIIFKRKGAKEEDRPFATFVIYKRGERFYCRLQLGSASWHDVWLLLSFNFCMELAPGTTDSAPHLCLSKQAFADGLSAPRNAKQSAFRRDLEDILLRRNPVDWRVLDYTVSEGDLQITFAYDDQQAPVRTDILAQIQVDCRGLDYEITHGEVGPNHPDS